MTDPFLQAAIDEAIKGLAAGGRPIGSVLVGRDNIIWRGHNQPINASLSRRNSSPPDWSSGKRK